MSAAGTHDWDDSAEVAHWGLTQQGGDSPQPPSQVSHTRRRLSMQVVSSFRPLTGLK